MAHIHLGGLGVAGAILVNTGLSSGDAGLSGGAGSFQKNGVNVPSDVAQGILNNPGNYYFNVHSQMNPNGVVRGQLDGSGVGGGTNPPSTDPGYGY